MTLIQQASNGQFGGLGGGTATTVTLSSTVAGNLLVAFASWGSPFTTWVNGTDSFTFPSGWIKVGGSGAGSNAYIEMWYYPNNPGSITTVALDSTKPGGVNNAETQYWIGETDSVAVSSPLDQSGTNTGSSNSPSVSTSVADAAGGNFVIAGFVWQTGSRTTLTRDGTYTAITVLDSNNVQQSQLKGEYKTAGGTATTQTAAPSLGASEGWKAIIATFKPSAVAPSATGSFTVPKFTMTAPAKEIFSTSTAFQMPVFQLAAQGATSRAAGAFVGPSFSMQAQQQEVLPGAGSFTMPGFHMAVTAQERFTGTGSFTMPGFSMLGLAFKLTTVSGQQVSGQSATSGTATTYHSSLPIHTVGHSALHGRGTYIAAGRAQTTGHSGLQAKGHSIFHVHNQQTGGRSSMRGHMARIPAVVGVSTNISGFPQMVTIKGKNFALGDIVLFGPYQAYASGLFTVVADGETITTFCPAPPAGITHDLVVDVQIVAPDGTSEVNAPSDQFIFVAPPVVTSVTPSAGRSGELTAIVLTGNNFLTTDLVWLGPYAFTDFHIDNDNRITAVVPATIPPGTYYAKVRNSNTTSAENNAALITLHIAYPGINPEIYFGERRVSFRYELLDRNDQHIIDLHTVMQESASINYNTTAKIKRTAKFKLVEEPNIFIDFASNRVRPWMQFHRPDNTVVEWPLGVFLLSTAPRTVDKGNVIYREVSGYDKLQILVDDVLRERLVLNKGTFYTDAITSLLVGAGITNMILSPSNLTLPVARDWKPGTPKLTVINDLIASISYQELWFDANGIAVVMAYVVPTARPVDWTYADDALSIQRPNVQAGLDLFKVPNDWVMVVSEPDRAVLKAEYTNNNPNSPTSVPHRGRTITHFISDKEAADQGTLDRIVQRTAFEESQVYETFTFETAVMPFHADHNTLRLINHVLGIDITCEELEWSFDLKAGSYMKHVCQRMVSV